MIHQYINNGYHIVLDVNSGSVHSVDALFYDVVKALSDVVADMEKPEKLTEDQRNAVVSMPRSCLLRISIRIMW